MYQNLCASNRGCSDHRDAVTYMALPLLRRMLARLVRERLPFIFMVGPCFANFLLSPGREVASKREMPTRMKTPGKPIYDRLASKSTAATQKDTLDAKADEIRKTWLQTQRSK